MMNINEGDANFGIGSIQSRVVGAGVNAESGRELSFSATDPLSELVYSSQKGLSLKFASSRTADKKPFLLWNINKAWGTPPDHDDMFVDKAVLLAAHSDHRESIGKMANKEDLNLQIAQHTADLQAQKENNMLISPRLKSRMCLYKEKGKEKALSDENDRSVAGLLSRGVKRQGYVNDAMHETKRIKNQITGNPFMSWISNMVRGFSHSNSQDSSSFPLPLACSIDVNAHNLHQNFIHGQDSASLMYKSTLSCKHMNILNAGEEKEKDDLCLSKQIIVCDNQARDGVITKHPMSEKCKVIIQETIGCSNLDSDEKNLESRDDSQVNQKCSTNTEVSFDVKSRSKVCSIQKFGSSEALAPVFAMRLGAFRHIAPFENNVKNEHQKSPLHDIVPAQEIFQAIQNLRLSRADILRWMNSDMPLWHLNGFFLRLRLRKMEQGLKGTRYYVACISAGEGREFSGCTSNKSIMVDVGGIKSCVTSQYVSNHDFLQDEIKTWWCRAVDRGCRVPSLDELNSKFNKRTSLGF